MKRREMWDLWCELERDCKAYDKALTDALKDLQSARREVALWQRKTEQADARHDKLKKAHRRQVEMISALYQVVVVVSALSYEPPGEESNYCLVENGTILALRKMAGHALKMVDIGTGTGGV